MLDLDDSPDFPGNKGLALGRPLAAYPLMAARASGQIRRHFVVTESPPVKAVALQNEAIIIDPPKGASAPASHATRAGRFLLHGYHFIKEELKGSAETLDLLAVFLAQAPAVTGETITAGFEALLSKPELDSAVSVSPGNRQHPSCAQSLDKDGLLEPYLTHPAHDQGEVWYPDWGVQLLRPRWIESMKGARPYPWLGRKVFALKQWGGCPIDYQSQIPSLEFWLKKHGLSDLSASLELKPSPKLQASPKGRR
jgi:hypothetical protein